MSAERTIAPQFTFRFTSEEIKAKYGSAEGAFAEGDFLIAAQLASPASAIKGCSLVLGGLIEQGLELLEALPPTGERMLLCRALALWQLNRDAEAIALLNEAVRHAPSERIDRFRRLLDRDDLTVFITGAMLPVFSGQHSDSMLAPSFTYGQITAKYVASQMAENAYDYKPSDPFDEFIDRLSPAERPDFLYALSPQWVLARNFHKVRQPKLLWAHDTDMFVYRNSESLALYDIGICGCTHEHFELSRGAGLYSVANIMSNPLNMPFPDSSPTMTKKIDVMFSGSSLDHFHSEKPRFIYQLAELADEHVIRIVDGHVPEKDYFELLTSTKFLTMVGRQAGAPSPRWRDALANGSCLLFPEGSFYDEVAPGCLPYRAETIADDIRRHIERFNRGGQKYPEYDTVAIAAEIDRRFAIHRQPREHLFASQLKYAAFLALVWRDVAPVERAQRRHIWLTPCIDTGIFGRKNVREKIADVAGNIQADELYDAEGYNNAAQLHAKLVFAFEYEDKRIVEWAERADHYFAEGLNRYPNSLLLAFNHAHWEFFKPDAKHEEAARLFQSIIDRFDDLTFDPCSGDIAFPYMLLDRDAVFPYYEYADAVTTELVRRKTPELRRNVTAQRAPREMLLAACHAYVGWARLKDDDRPGALARFANAFAVHPGGLPLLRLNFEARLSECVPPAKPSKAEVARLADAYFAVVNVYPTALLTHIAAVVPVLAVAGETKAARELLAGWYRLGNIVFAVNGTSRFHDSENFKLLYHYRSLLPKSLVKQVEACLNGSIAPVSLTQFELTMVDAVRTYSAAQIDRRVKSRKWWLAIIGNTRPVSVDDKGDPLSLALLWRAFRIWWRLPPKLKGDYAWRALRWTQKGNLRQAAIRAQLWGATSMWSRGIG